MSWSGYVVLKVPVLNLTDEEMDDVNRDALGFLVEFDLIDEATVQSVAFESTDGGS